MRSMIVAAVLVMNLAVPVLAADDVVRAVDESQYAEPILVSAAIGGPDTIPVDAAGIGGAHLLRLPLDDRSPATRAAEQDIVTAMNWERERRGLFPFVFSEHLTQIEHRWIRWLSANYDGECPFVAGGPERSCDAGPPEWDQWAWASGSLQGLTGVGGGALRGAAKSARPGYFVSGLIQSPGHRADLLGLDGRFVGIGIECLPDGSTYMTYSVWDHDRQYLWASPSTYTGSDVTSAVPASFGRRCPQPGPSFTASPGPGTVTITPDVDQAFAALTSGRHEIDGPLLGNDSRTWTHRLRVFDGASQVGAHEWRVLAPLAIGGVAAAPPYVVDGLTPGTEYRFVLEVRNEYETSLSVERTAVPSVAMGPPPDGPARGDGFQPVVPYRVVDTRSGDGGRLAAGDGRAFVLDGAPAEASAATLNVTAVGPATAGYLTLHPCGGERPATSNVNFPAGTDTANQVTVALGSAASLCVWSSTATDVLIDVAGWWHPSAQGTIVGLRPTRVLDSRPHGVLAGATVAIDLRGLVPPRSTAATLTVTATQTKDNGFVTVHPCGGDVPTVSNLNQRVGLDRANLVTVAMSGEQRVCVTSSDAGALVVDLVNAWTDDPTGDRLDAEEVPVRALDTRTSGNRLAPMEVRQLLPERDGVVFGNVTVDRTGAAGWLAAFPCDDGFTGTSTVNYAGASSASTAVAVDAGRGGVCAVASTPTDVIVDVFATAAGP